MTEWKAEKTFGSFYRYCLEHPEERFWQPLRNWSGHAFIYAADELQWGPSLKDTFFWNGMASREDQE